MKTLSFAPTALLVVFAAISLSACTVVVPENAYNDIKSTVRNIENEANRVLAPVADDVKNASKDLRQQLENREGQIRTDQPLGERGSER